MWFRWVVEQAFGEEQVRVIAQALPAFVIAVLAATLLATVIVAWALRWKWSTLVAHRDARIGSLEERVKMRDDQLNNKFQTTSPDEARQMMEALRAQVARLTPRRLPKEKRPALLEQLRLPPGGPKQRVDIEWEALIFDAEMLAQDLVSLFDTAGWDVGGSREIGGDPKSGIMLAVINPSNLTPTEIAVRTVLEQSGLTFNLVGDKSNAVPAIHIGHPEH
jgi:hypothetical protein